MTTDTIDDLRPKLTSAEATRAKLAWVAERWEYDIREVERPMSPRHMTKRAQAAYRCPYTTTDAHTLRSLGQTLIDLADEINDQNAEA